MASSIRIGGVAAGTVQGLQGFLDRIAAIPEGLVQDIHRDLSDGADELVDDIRPLVPVSPVSDLETHPGQLRDSVHREDGRHGLSVLVVEDARDAKGNFIGPHVEYGHKDKGGGHVAALPHFNPAVRVFKPKLRARIGRSLSKRIKGTAGA
jgi:hypothetical protein